VATWEWLSGLSGAGESARKAVEAIDWLAYAPLPYVEFTSINIDGVTRHRYKRHR
jgi:hypothetical protein